MLQYSVRDESTPPVAVSHGLINLALIDPNQPPFGLFLSKVAKARDFFEVFHLRVERKALVAHPLRVKLLGYGAKATLDEGLCEENLHWRDPVVLRPTSFRRGLVRLSVDVREARCWFFLRFVGLVGSALSCRSISRPCAKQTYTLPFL